ncbi:hypothetical protein D3C84_1211470 [compost metagenome]
MTTGAWAAVFSPQEQRVPLPASGMSAASVAEVADNIKTTTFASKRIFANLSRGAFLSRFSAACFFFFRQMYLLQNSTFQGMK